MKEPLLRAEDVAQLLNVRVSTIYDAAARGRIPAVRLWQGRRKALLRFRVEDIEQLVREKTINAGGARREDE